MGQDTLCRKHPGPVAVVSAPYFRSQGPRFESCSLRKHAYSNTLKILPPKNENFQIKNSDIFHISTQNIGCG